MIMIGANTSFPEWFAVAMFSKSDAMGLLVAFPVMYVLIIAIHELAIWLGRWREWLQVSRAHHRAVLADLHRARVCSFEWHGRW